MKLFVYSVIVIVSAAVIGGFLVVGSPQEERLRRFDEQRVSSLQYIQSEVLNYWINKGTLPKALSDLRDDLRGIVIPTDPETGTNYVYSVKDKMGFSICANFSRPNNYNDPKTGRPVTSMAPYYDGLSQNWQHDAGYTCFDRTIDPDYYPPVKTR